MRFSRRLLLAFLVVSVVPLLLAGVLADRTNRLYVDGYMGARFQSDAWFGRYSIDRFVAVGIRDAQSIRAGLQLAAYDFDAASSTFEELTRINTNLLRVRWFDPSGIVRASNTADDLGQSVAAQSLELQQLISTARTERDPHRTYVSTVDASGTMDFVTPVVDRDGLPNGALVMSLSMRYALDVLKPYTDQLGEKSTFVVDANNRVVFSRSKEWPPGTELPASQAVLLNNIPDDPSRKMAERYALLGAEHYVAEVPMDAYGANHAGKWRFVSILPYDLVMTGVNKTMAKASGALLVLVAGAIAAAIWLSRSIGRPLLQLTRSAHAVASGDCSQRVAIESGSAEMKQLALAFNQMAEAVAAKTSALEHEVAQRRASEEALLKAQAAAEAANRAKSEFLANMSHEIRTPMNGVLGFTNLLLDTPLSDEQRDYVQTIRGSGESLLHVINDILDFSKIESGKMQIEHIDFQIAKAAEEVAELLSPQAEAKGLELALRVAPEVPLSLQGDPGHVRQVLLNLVGNAVKFTTRGHVLIEIDLIESAISPHDRRIRCEVTDTGVGIPANKQSLLFSEFSQADSSTTREFGGTGLGLAISKRLVGLMGGEIGFDSAPGKGSRFWFTLPAPAQCEPKVAAIPALPPEAVRVLIVDDLEVNRRLLSEQFRRWGLLHECASSGAEALELLTSATTAGRPFQIALIDFLMPGMDGLELGRNIRSISSLRTTALIMLTSGSQRSEAPAFLAAGFDAFLIKPLVRPAHLMDAMVKAWSAHRLECAPRTSPAVGRSAETATLEPTEPVSRPRVLVADDNTVNQLLVRRMLERFGCRVDIANDGQEAVNMSTRLRYDLILMDCSMPEMDGYVATRLIRARESADHTRVPIIALTAHAMADDRDKCLAAGMDDYMSKPVSKVELQRTVERYAARNALDTHRTTSDEILDRSLDTRSAVR